MTLPSRHISRQLATYIDGELAPRREQQVRIHLGRCERCQAEREQVALGMAAVEELPVVEAPASIWLSIEAALEENRQAKMPTVRPWRLAFVLAILLVLAVTGYWRVARHFG